MDFQKKGTRKFKEDITMGMIVQHNMNALNAYNRLNANVAGMKKASEKLSSGYRINRAGDDAAGLAISEKMRSQIKGLNQAIRNSQDGINMIQTFEGAAQETHSILQRMKELATESANGTYDNATDRAAIQLEFDHLNDELNQIADTDFNGTIVLNGGEMADGLKAEAGAFDYANLEKQLAAEKAKAPVDMVAKKDYSTKDPDLQDSKYLASDPNDKTAVGAGLLWDTAVNADGQTTLKDANEIYIKYSVDTVDDDGNVTAYKGQYVDAEGNVLGDYSGTINATDNGGFTDAVTGVNVTMNTIGAKAGDFVTVKYTKPPVSPEAPTNMNISDDFDGTADKDSIKVTAGTGTNADILQDNIRDGIKVKLDAGVTDTNWVDAAKGSLYQAGVKALDGATVKFNVNDVATTAKLGAITNVSVNGGANLATNAPTAGSPGLFIDTNTAGKVTFKYGDANTSVAIGEIDLTAIDGAGGNAAATIELKLNIDGYVLPSTDKPNAELVADKSTPIDKSVSEANAYKNSTAKMTYSEEIILQTGSRTKDAVNFSFTYNADGSADMGTLKNNLNLSSRADGLNTANLSLANQDDANYAIDQIDKAINKTSMVRATFGAIQNRLEHKITNLTTTSENLQEAESSIRDTDMASEMMNYTKYNILQQAAQSMLAQANQQPQSILQLLG